VGGGRALVFEAAEAVFETACVGEGQGFGDFHDQAVGSEFQRVWVCLSVLEVLRAWDAAEDLDAWAGGVAEEAQEGKADSDGDADA
jgi:hypothetical protein